MTDDNEMAACAMQSADSRVNATEAVNCQNSPTLQGNQPQTH